jgi:hypothetical protein
MTEQKTNIHIGLCGQCRGNVTHDGASAPRCEQCGAIPVAGPVLPMVGPVEGPATYDQPPLVRDRKGRFRRPGEA